MNLKSVLATINALCFGKINLLLLITNRCNSRCTICNLWKQEKTDLPTEIIRQLLDSKIVNKNGILLEGGEAILHPAIKAILYMLKGLNYVLLTNGLLPNQLKFLVYECKIPNISVSLDGARETYQKIRGVDGYDKVLKTISSLKELTKLSVCFTISPGNTYDDYLHVKKICEEHKVDLLLNIYSDKYYSLTEAPSHFHNDLIDYRYEKLPNNYVNKYNSWARGEIKSNCFGTRYNCNIFPDGKVVLCQTKPNVILGNLHEKSIDKIWKNRKKMYCNDCWLSCNRYLEAKWL